MTNKRLLWMGVVVAMLAGALLLGRGLMQKRAAVAASASAASASGGGGGGERAAQAVELASSDVALATQAELSRLLAVNGSLKAVQSAFVKARVAGEVKQLGVREGDRVAAGQLIGQLDATEYEWRLRQAQDQAQAAQAQLDIAQRTLANNRALVDQGFISRNALDTSVSSTTGATATLQAARAAAEIARKAVRDSEIRAPIAGLVAQRLVQPGERVGIDARMVEIVDLSRIELEAAVAPEDVVLLRVGQAAQVQVDGLTEPVRARLVRINPSAQAGTRSVLAYFELAPGASAAGLRQGLFARARIELQRKTALVVPVSALRLDQARPYVLAVQAGKAVARVVTPGERGEVTIAGVSEAAVEITAGLEPGTVVLRGTVGALREGTPVKLPLAGAPAAPSSAAAGATASR